jgi:hypothetical protein
MRNHAAVGTRARAPLGSSKNKSVSAPPVAKLKVKKRDIDWAVYNNELVNRGRVFSVVLDLATLPGWILSTGRPGRPPYSVEAINACHQYKALMHLTLRSTEGALRDLFRLAGLDESLVPDFSTLCSRRGDVKLNPPKIKPGGVLLIDGSGISYRAKGPWAQQKYGTQRRRYVRLTLTVDADSGAITAAAVTPEEGEGTGEVSQVPALLEPQAPAALVGDGAYDTREVYEYCHQHGIRLVTPPRCTAVLGLHPDRDQVIRQVQRLGSKTWKEKSGYHCRSWVESAIGALKQTLGDVTSAHTFSGAQADVISRINVYNRWLATAA